MSSAEAAAAPAAALDVVVIGAGLAGACSAWQAAQAGLRVLVLDRAPQPAQGASALPVGLMAPRKNATSATAAGQTAHTSLQVQMHVNLSPPLPPHWSDSTSSAAHALLQELTALGKLRRGQDWQTCGAWQTRAYEQAKKKPKSLQSADKRVQITPNPANWKADSCIWHATAAWVKPARLVQACLAHPLIQFMGGTAISQITQEGAYWRILAENGCIFRANKVLIAASYGSAELLARSAFTLPQTLHATAGQVIMGAWDAALAQALPALAQGQEVHALAAYNGHGHFIPAVPDDKTGAPFWLSGATYLHGAPHMPASALPQLARSADSAQAMLANCTRLAELLPSLAPHLHSATQAAALRTWAGVRCTTPARVPQLRALAPGLWLFAGLGSRGLADAPLGAQWLAAQLLR